MKKAKNENYRIVVNLAKPFMLKEDAPEYDERMRRATNHLAGKVRDLLAAADESEHEVDATWDTIQVCVDCGYEWELDSDGAPVCCGKAIDEWTASQGAKAEGAKE